MDSKVSNEATNNRPDGRFFYAQSQEFYENYQDLLPQGHGVVCQLLEEVRVLPWPGTQEEIEQRKAELSQPQQPHETVLFDGRYRDQGVFSWQYTYAEIDNGRSVMRLDIDNSGGVTGWESKYYANGQLINSIDLLDDSINKTWQRIGELATDQSTIDNIVELRRIRQETKEKLEIFRQTREMKILVPPDAVSKHADVVKRTTYQKQILQGILPIMVDEEIVHVRIKLRDDTSDTLIGHYGDNPLKISYKKELKKRERHLNTMGFTALQICNKPTT